MTDAVPRGVGRRGLLRSPAGALGLTLTTFVVALAVAAPLLSENPFVPVDDLLLSPSRRHLLGTDQFGRDVLACVAHGARTSLSLVISVAVMSGAIGILVGVIAGYHGSLLDDALMRVTEMVQSIPRLLFAILAVTVLGPGTRPLALLLGLTSWTFLARVVRAETLVVRQREFVESAEAQGASFGRIAATHVVPNILPTALVVIALVASRMIMLEAGLAFLGLTDPNVMSWGMLIRNADAYLHVAWWISIFPGLAVAIGVLGLNLLSDGLSDVLDPIRSGPPARVLGEGDVEHGSEIGRALSRN